MELEEALLSLSGTNAVCVEPRELDGRQVSKSYQVIWLPRHTAAQAMVLRQTITGIIGLARLGHRWGVRCRVGDRIAKRRRQSDLHHVFKDCARDPPKQVDLLVHTIHAEVVSCDFDACTLELDRPSPFRTDVPLLGGGHAMAITDQFESQLAVEGMAPIDPGDKVRQTQVVTEVSAVHVGSLSS